MSKQTLDAPKTEDAKALAAFDSAHRLMLADEFDQALAVCSGARVWPELSETNYYRGWIYFLKKEYQMAIDEFTIRLLKQPNCALAMYFRGLCSEELNDHFEALCDYTNALDEDEDFVIAYYARGQLRAALMDFNGAVDDYNEAIEIEPGFADAWYSRALIFEEFEQFGEAIRGYDQQFRSIRLMLMLCVQEVCCLSA